MRTTPSLSACDTRKKRRHEANGLPISDGKESRKNMNDGF